MWTYLCLELSGWLLHVVKDILRAQFVGKWFSDLQSSTKCDHYRNFKQLFEYESYLSLLPYTMYKWLLKFRTCNHKLPVEVGRYTGIERKYRLCNSCNLGVVGDEFHYLFECTNNKLLHMRKCTLPSFYQRYPTTANFYHLMQNLKDKQLLFSMCTFVKVIFATV